MKNLHKYEKSRILKKTQFLQSLLKPQCQEHVDTVSSQDNEMK